MEYTRDALAIKDQQLKTILCVYTHTHSCITTLCILLASANKKKSIIDTQIRKSNPNTTLKIVIKPQEKRTREEGK